MLNRYTRYCTLLVGLVGSTTTPNIPAQTTLYVDDDADPGGDGLSWNQAYRFLSDALARSAESAGGIKEIRVAGGLYLPDRSRSQPAGSGNRLASFGLVDGVAIRGGYGGIGSSSPDDRDIDQYVTTLSGDLLGDDPSLGDNSYHVVRSSSVGPTAILEGFTITAGVADGDGHARGGGMRNWPGGSPTVMHCRFFGNQSTLGGAGMANIDSSSPVVRNCLFINNFDPRGNGAGMYCLNECSPQVTSCAFIGNNTGHVGGGLAMRNQCHPVVVNCVFSGNRAGDFSGAVRAGNTGSSPIFLNCTFVGNSTPGVGGAYGAGSDNADSLTNPGHSMLINCIFWGNTDSIGSQIALNGSYPANVTVIHCVVEGGEAGIHVEPGFELTWGAGNIDLDPRLTDPDGPDDMAGTLDDDVSLLPDSPCINRGLNSAPGLPASDLAGNDRMTCGVVDIGALEAPEPASGCVPSFRRGDCNDDGYVDISDAIGILFFQFMGSALSCVDAADADDDSETGITDVIYLLSHLFLEGPVPRDPYPGCGPDVNNDVFPPCDYPAESCE